MSVDDERLTCEATTWRGPCRAACQQTSCASRHGQPRPPRACPRHAPGLHCPRPSCGPRQRRGPWDRKIRGLDERLPKPSGQGPAAARRQPRTSPSRLPRQKSESGHGQRGRRLLLHKVECGRAWLAHWTTVEPTSPSWLAIHSVLDSSLSRLRRGAGLGHPPGTDGTGMGSISWEPVHPEAHAVAPRARRFLPVRRRPASSSDWLLVWMFTSIPDARVEVKDEFLASSPDQAPELTVSRHPADTHAAFDREVERLGARPYRPGQGHKRFPLRPARSADSRCRTHAAWSSASVPTASSTTTRRCWRKPGMEARLGPDYWVHTEEFLSAITAPW